MKTNLSYYLAAFSIGITAAAKRASAQQQHHPDRKHLRTLSFHGASSLVHEKSDTPDSIDALQQAPVEERIRNLSGGLLLQKDPYAGDATTTFDWDSSVPASFLMSMSMSNNIEGKSESLHASKKSGKSGKMPVLDTIVQGYRNYNLSLLNSILQNTDYEEDDTTKFNMDLSLTMVNTANEADAFVLARKKWMDVIVGDLIPFPSNQISNICNVPLPTIIDDTHICGFDGDIDGPLNILGYAGPSWYRDQNVLGYVGAGAQTLTGYMVFDRNDIPFMIEKGLYEDVVLHEMGHVLGVVGVYDLGVVDHDTWTYTGKEGLDVWQNDWGCVGAPPLQQGGGHWDEECFPNELMTPSINTSLGESPKLSKLTIAALKDQGYEVDYDAADDYDGSDTTCCWGETVASSEPSNTKPTLSEAGKGRATEFGLEKLKEMQLPSEEVEGIKEETGIMYVGDKHLTVFYYEDGVIYDVHVSSE